MNIELKGLQKCNLFVGGDSRDKSLQSVIEGTPHKMFLVRKSDDGWLEVWQADEIVAPVVPNHIPNDKPRTVKKSFKKKKVS